ncbi:DUF2971 domain-containing protein [Flagellimonas baculiformis]|uniref:DUF2971 domain-containing protein n=1 Tax=Flagellimonas baculiformis TaxID=3067310 RepID=UPI00296FD1FE|nr:DUF2971 domain-containing protein [Muricauda sp. D6]
MLQENSQNIYYKFRDLKNYQYLLDIILNQRLYAASFRNLNDNFEGQFILDNQSEAKRYRLNPRKQDHISVCSFSKTYKNHLMWSHYSDGHRGIVIGFTVDDSLYKIEKVAYSGLATFNFFPNRSEDLKNVFLNKIKEWDYEQEYRIMREKQEYIEIEIKEIIFGAETPEIDKTIISKLAKLINPDIVLKTYYD